MNAYCPLASVSVSELLIPDSLTVTPPRPSFSTITVPMMAEVRIQEPGKLTVTFSPSVAIVAGDDV